ncbi:MAG: type III polyketide synthase [Planctomycetes bacterium]|nr:type III polyketide synthase [Planctomycetota bacterium]
MTACVLGMGTALPPHCLPQADVARLVGRLQRLDGRRERALATLYRRADVDSRGIALLEPDRGDDELTWFYAPSTNGGQGPGTEARMREFTRRAPQLAEAAGRSALADAGTEAGEITHLVVATCTGFGAPGIEIELVHRLGLRPTVQRLMIGFMGCHAALNALQAASAFAQADSRARVLVCCVELCGLHLQYDDTDQQGQVAGALFADGAAAMIVGEGGGAGAWRVVDTASQVCGNTRDAMGWRVGDHGFVMSLSPRVPGLVAAALRPWLDDWLAGHDLDVSSVRSWAIHAGGPRIVTAVAERLGLGDAGVSVSRRVLREIGNVSSATVPFILERLRAENAPMPCVALSFGPGLVAEAVLFDE